MKVETAKQAAKLLGVTEAQAKAQYAVNAKQLHECAKRAGTGLYRGATAARWQMFAEHADDLAK